MKARSLYTGLPSNLPDNSKRGNLIVAFEGQPIPQRLRSPVLNSWKEIAAYLGRGIRTAQRWERDLGLPVRRPKAKDRSAVVAFPEELEGWLRRTPVGINSGGHTASELRLTVLQLGHEMLALSERLLLGMQHHERLEAEKIIGKMRKTLDEFYSLARLQNIQSPKIRDN